MPSRPQRPCAHPGCGTLVDRGRCAAHQREQDRRAESGRPNATARLYTWQWRKESKAFLREHPLCWYCEREGRTTAARCVDHVIPHRGNIVLFWDRSNWRPACIACNSAKAARDEGAFGNAQHV